MPSVDLEALARGALEPGETVVARAPATTPADHGVGMDVFLGAAVIAGGVAWVATAVIGALHRPLGPAGFCPIASAIWLLLAGMALRSTRRRVQVLLTERRVLVAVEGVPTPWQVPRLKVRARVDGKLAALDLALDRPRSVHLEPGDASAALVAALTR